MKKNILRIIQLLATLFVVSTGYAQLHTLNLKSASGLQSFFRYTGEKKTIISGHRGSDLAGHPENAIETFEYVLRHTPAFFEIDPRLTKDSVIVLLHDATLDRTTTGKGKLSDFTWEEVKKLRLKDKDGNETPYRIPTLKEAINWARGKTILNLDKKDVPPQMIVDIIKANNAGSFVMVTVHNAQQAKFYYDNNSQQMMSAFVKTEQAFKEYEAAGVPWKNMIAYIGSENISSNKIMFDLLHARGVMCMISAAPVYDKLSSLQERATSYREIFVQGADILESDYPVEVAEAIGPKR